VGYGELKFRENIYCSFGVFALKLPGICFFVESALEKSVVLFGKDAGVVSIASS
jgi:hypothetical protein